ncbi:MAG: pyruvate, phosphate dikinase [Cyclobacteriaceae bacterium]
MLIETIIPEAGKPDKKSSFKKTFVYSFEKGDPSAKQLLGGKGANLCAMTRMGLKVPPGFVITTEACLTYLTSPDKKLPEGLTDQVKSEISRLEQITGKKFGDPENPLLVSVRSGSALSMPGMMDTILNLGLSEVTVPGLIRQTGNERFAYDAFRRLIQLFGKIALGISDEKFTGAMERKLHDAGFKSESSLDSAELKSLCEDFLKIVQQETGEPFPADANSQLEIAIRAVFNSWMGKRAVDYRKEFRITPEMANGTAVNIVTMVFGNMGPDSATGVGFTRDPGTGERVIYGEYLINAQGEDVVAGIRTPRPVSGLKKDMPEQYKQLLELNRKLELHFREVQDYEYTIERGVLYCLQTRNGKMNATALVRTSVEMVQEGLLTKEQALLRIKPEILEQLLHPMIDPTQILIPVASGLPASPGAATGKVVFDADRAEVMNRAGEAVILVREETRPEDIHGFFAARGILTSRGGKTSHAAVVARGMGKPCVAGAGSVRIDLSLRQAFAGEFIIREGDFLTIDGSDGNIYMGALKMIEPKFSRELSTILGWSDEVAGLKVFANADTPEDAARAVEFGAMGIGLCRTERMFNASDRLPVVIDMILADKNEDRETALAKLHQMQKDDFIKIFKVMSPRPVTIRLLDPPIHEFLPSETRLTDEIKSLQELSHLIRGVNTLFADALNPSEIQARPGIPFSPEGESSAEEMILKKQKMLQKAHELKEINPMLGHRGVRLGITRPDIYEMQISAIMEAAVECRKAGIQVNPEIMVPQVSIPEELENIKKHTEAIADRFKKEKGVKPLYRFGTMIEVVRACLEAGDLAKSCDFFSFGTNDLTQATFSFSREDAENKFLPAYLISGILQDNPFEKLDIRGVGKLMKMAASTGRQVKPDLKIGICGEHGGQPAAIEFCYQIGLNYVSCSALRVPLARMAAAHAAIGKKVQATL